MESISQTLQKLEGKLSLTSSDSTQEPEDYILTEDEEKSCIDHAITQAKRRMEWRFKEMGFSGPEILKRISETNFLEEINTDEILDLANSTKHQQRWHQQQRVRERMEAKERHDELVQYWTAKRIYHFMCWVSENSYGKKFIMHDDNKRLIATICYFLSGDQRLSSELNMDPKKGLLIRGISGLGKTYVVKCASQNLLNPVLIQSMIEISEEIQQNGSYDIPIGNHKKIYLDDVGTEEHNVKYYGTSINWFKNFIERFYLGNKPFNQLIISTNNNAEEIENKYGFRVRSRMKDMFNVVDVVGQDMRG